MSGETLRARRSAARRDRYHSVECFCRDCRHPSPADGVSRADHIAWRCLQGVLIGLVLVFVIDRATDGPGVLTMFGL